MFPDHADNWRASFTLPEERMRSKRTALLDQLDAAIEQQLRIAAALREIEAAKQGKFNTRKQRRS